MNHLPRRYTFRIEQPLFHKLQYIALHHHCSINQELTCLIKQCIAQFEKEHGPIAFVELHQ